MKKLICLLLSLLTVLSLAACGETAKKETQPPVETTQETTQEPTEQTTEPVSVEAVTSFYMDMKEADQESAAFINAYKDGEGKAYVEYNTASGHKVATMEAKVLEQLAAAYRMSVLSQFNGQEVYDEGEACCSVYIDLGGETCSYSFYGEMIPEEYATVFADMEALVVQIMADQPEYVAAPQMGENLDLQHVAAITAILENSGIEALDSLSVMNVEKDEYFAYTAGLSGSEGIESCTNCAALMMSVPYSLVVVTLAEGTDASTVVDDFAKNIDWLKWVCVQPNSATIAVKDNMVLCLLGQDEMYTGTAAAIEENGWTVEKTLDNPNT